MPDPARTSTRSQQVPAEFPRYRFSGTHREIGRQYGEACTEAIALHLDLALERLSTGSQVSRQDALDATARYRDFVVEHAWFLDEEIRGVADGAGLSLPGAYLLQLRAELQRPALDPSGSAECTTFAVLPEAAADGTTSLIGQNADLPAFYAHLGVVIEVVPDDGPACLLLTPAGQVSYIGINDRGLGVFANFLHCDGWRTGFPRYLLTRLALQHDTVAEATAAVQAVPRASSRNLIMLDATGVAADIETIPSETASLHPHDGLLAHSNHFLSDELREEERQRPLRLENSQHRYHRMDELLRRHHGSLDMPTMQRILRDRGNVPNALCIAPGDEEDDNITFASVIAQPTIGRLTVAVGPPHEHDYISYEFEDATADVH